MADEKTPSEKIMIIPLRQKQVASPKNMKMKRSVREIRAFLAKHMKTDQSNVFISQQLNESLWKKGFHGTPSKLKVKVVSDKDGKIFARLMDEKEKVKKERKIGLRERLARRKDETKAPAKEEKKAEKKPTAKPAKETEKAQNEVEQDILLEQP